MSRTCRRILAFITLLLVVLGILRWRYVTRQVHDGDIARVSWLVSHRPMLVHVSLMQSRGVPLPGAEVGLANNSGWQFARTDTNGFANLQPGERDVDELTVNGVRVAKDPWVRVDEGLEIVILIKDTNAIPREPPKLR